MGDTDRVPKEPVTQRRAAPFSGRLDDRLAVIVALAAGAALQWSVTDAYALVRPGWLLPVLELLLVAVLLVTGRRDDHPVAGLGGCGSV